MRWQRAAHNALFDRAFAWYVKRLLGSSFSAVWVRGNALPDAGYVGIANHQSWWDGFLPYTIAHVQQPSKRIAIMMSDVELRRFPYFRFAGAFSIDASSMRGAHEAIAYAAGWARNGAGVWIMPDGILRAPGERLHFSSGFAHAARMADVPVVPLAIRLAFLNRQRPEAFVSIGAALEPQRDLVSRAQRYVEAQLESIDGDLARGDRTSFRQLLRGAPGIDDRVALDRR